MNSLILIAIVSAIVSVAAVPRILKSDDHTAFKVACILIVLIPVLGPLMYFWTSNMPQKQSPEMQGRESYGNFFHRQLSRRRDLDKHNRP